MALLIVNIGLSASKLFFPGVIEGLLLTSENIGLSASTVTPGVRLLFSTVNEGLSTSWTALPVWLPLSTVNEGLSSSKVFGPGITETLPFSNEKAGLSASKVVPLGGWALPFRTVKNEPSASPSRDGIAGKLFGSSGSVPKNASTTSWNPSQSVSAREVR